MNISNQIQKPAASGGDASSQKVLATPRRLWVGFWLRRRLKKGGGKCVGAAQPRSRHLSSVTRGGFTMIEIAISLAIIGIALVAIIGVLPLGLNVQRDNRQTTIVNQDASVFLQAVTGGSQGLNDLTNYVYAITNNWTFYPLSGASQPGVNGYSDNSSSVTWPAPRFSGNYPLTNGLNIIGLMTTPEFTDADGYPISDIYHQSYYSNHVVAYVRSLSGSAVEKPPQDNDLVRNDSFSYRIYCVNAPVAGYIPPLWQAQSSYNVGDIVSYILNGQTTYWQAIQAEDPPLTPPSLPPQAGDVPNSSIRWVRNLYPQELSANLHDLRLTFLWPILPNGQLPSRPARQTFRTLVPGLILHTNGADLYFYQNQSFTNAP
jgi:prepilin-type N-terminal cleavage/methylation domain-containing protein